MARKNVKTEEVKVMVPDETVVADVIKENEIKDVVEAVETKENLAEIPVEAIESNSVEAVIIEENVEAENQNANESKVEAEEVKQEFNESLTDNMESKESTQVIPPVAFKSTSEEARYYIMDMLKDGESHKKSEIVSYITERSGKVYSDAIVINVLRNMVSSGSLISLERGIYKLGSGIGLVSKLIQFIEVTTKSLDKITTVSMLNIKEEDFQAIKEVKVLRESLENIYERLSNN